MKKTKWNRGFTLIEILIVITIISILFIALIPQISGFFLKSKESGIRTDFQSFRLSSQSYLHEKLSTNIQLDDFNKFLDESHKISNSGMTKYTKSTDPWGNHYEVVFEAQKIKFASYGQKGDPSIKEYNLVSYYHNGVVDSCTSGFKTNNMLLTKIKNLSSDFVCGDDLTEGFGLSAPTNFATTTVTQTRVELTWDSVSNASSYILKKDGNIIYTGSDTSYKDISLNSGVTYRYEVASENITQTSSFTTLNVTTLTYPADETVSLPTEKQDGCSVIRTIGQLQSMKQDLLGCYILGNDIDASVTINWNNGKGFEPVGTISFNYFKGSFDGKGYKIKNLYINRPAEKYVGLFGFVFGNSNSEIKNIILENVNIKGSEEVGGLAGYLYVKTSNVFVSGNVTADRSGAGGIAGKAEYQFLDSSFSTATVKGDNVIGGLIGTTYDLTLSNSYFAGIVEVSTSYGEAGGLVGWDWKGEIKNSYNIGKVKGLIASTIVHRVNETNVTGSYYNKESMLGNVSNKGVGKTTVEMKQKSTYVNWDFTNIWGISSSINDGYPYLINNPPN